jgi:hypothetical protein
MHASKVSLGVSEPGSADRLLIVFLQLQVPPSTKHAGVKIEPLPVLFNGKPYLTKLFLIYDVF